MRALTLASIVLFCACGTGGTGEEAVPFTLSFEADPAGRSFTNYAGWEVELEEALLAVGPVTLFENTAPTASLWERLGALVVTAAHAHSGFDEYDGGRVRGELIAPVVIDVLGGRQQVELEGIAGRVRSVTLELRPAADERLHGMQAWVRGTARREGEVVPFEGGLRLPGDAKSRRVTGVPAELELAAGSEVTIKVHPQRWFADADFGSLPDEAAEGVRPIPADSQVHAAWFIGARGFGAFTVR